jgi:DNA (cytosine-5)-methyltransferase 1
MNELALFAGAGGGVLGGHLLGWRTVCAVEWQPYPAGVLLARQNDGMLPTFPIWDDVQTFDGKPWQGIVDVISGGFPCQDISIAGKGKGIEGERSGMWKHMARIIGEVRPKFVFVENSPMLTTRGLGTVLADLSKMGFDAEWGVMGANYVGAPHKRERIWILAYSKHSRYFNSIKRINDEKIGIQEKNREEWSGCGLPVRASGMERNGQSNRLYDGRKTVSNSDNKRLQGREISRSDEENRPQPDDEQPAGCSRKSGRGWEVEPDVGRVANGVAARMDRIKALGNGQVSQVAAIAWQLLSERIET